MVDFGDYDGNEREKQRRLMNRKRADARDIDYTPCLAPKRRAVLEADTPRWLRAFFPVRLSHPFTDQQREWIEQIEARMVSGGDKAIAAPRGEGKTTIAELVLLKAILTGRIRYAVLVAATGPHAKRSLRNIKRAIEKSTRLGRYYPEVCFPVTEMDRAPQRAKKQTCGGVYTDMRWETEAITFPTVHGSRCSGSMISCHGLDSAIRGINEEGLRPDFVLIDDPETRESASSALQVEAREEIIEKDLAGLGGPGEICGRLILCTLQNKTCLSAKYTSDEKPWDGKRYKLLEELPKDKERWEQYLELQKKSPTEATAFYALNREAMDAGAIVSNPYRFIADVELSSIQHFYNWVARIGWDAVMSEFQNDPPEEAGPQSSGLDAALVESRLHDYGQGSIPDDCHALTIGVDVGKHRLHWVAVAWSSNAAGFIVDYDELRCVGTSPEDTVQLSEEKAILQALINLRQQWIERPFVSESGAIVEPKIVMIDSGSGLQQPAVYQFVRAVGHRPFVAAKGFARGGGSTPFYSGKQSPTRRIGDHWFHAKQDQAPDIWLHGFDADYWKRWTHQRFLTPTLTEEKEYRSGTLSLWKSPQSHRHRKFSTQIEAEVWTVDFTPGRKGESEYWERRHGANHYLDSLAMAAAAGSMCGVRIVGESKPKPKRVPLGQMGRRAG